MRKVMKIQQSKFYGNRELYWIPDYNTDLGFVQ